MLAAGKARITEPLARAILTLAAMQVSRTDDGVAEVQARAHLVTTPIYSLHDLPPHAVITDPAHKLPAGRLPRGDQRPARVLRPRLPAQLRAGDERQRRRKNQSHERPRRT